MTREEAVAEANGTRSPRGDICEIAYEKDGAVKIEALKAHFYSFNLLEGRALVSIYEADARRAQECLLGVMRAAFHGVKVLDSHGNPV